MNRFFGMFRKKKTDVEDSNEDSNMSAKVECLNKNIVVDNDDQSVLTTQLHVTIYHGDEISLYTNRYYAYVDIESMKNISTHIRERITSEVSQDSTRPGDGIYKTNTTYPKSIDISSIRFGQYTPFKYAGKFLNVESVDVGTPYTPGETNYYPEHKSNKLSFLNNGKIKTIISDEVYLLDLNDFNCNNYEMDIKGDTGQTGVSSGGSKRKKSKARSRSKSRSKSRTKSRSKSKKSRSKSKSRSYR